MSQKVFSLIYNEHELYKKCLALRKIPEGIDYSIFTERFITSGNMSCCFDSDIERHYLLQLDPSAWYLDCDVIIEKWPDFEMEPGYPYFSCSNGAYDMWAILGNNCNWVFDYLMEAYERDKEFIKPFWAHKIINEELQDRIKPIPQGYFKHLYFSCIIPLAEASGNRVATKDFSVEYFRGAWDLHIC